MKTLLALCAGLLAFLPGARASLLDVLGLGQKTTNDTAVLSATKSLSQDQVAQGLKEALGKGVQEAVARLGHDGGFLTNLNVKIPMPEKLQAVEKTLRALRQNQLADNFVATMNHAAEQAVPEAAPVLADAIKAMSIQDAKGILLGTNNAATEYFRRTSETNLYAKFLPIVKRATSQTGVTAAYKQLMEKAAGANSFGSFGRALLGAESVDVDAYVTSHALDGLFKMLADEETRIRQNPAARTTALLRQVFGAASK